MTRRANLIEPQDLASQLDDPATDVVLLDASWYLPTENRRPHREYAEAHIPGAQYFDIDKISDQDSVLPHMIPTESFFTRAARDLGVSRDSRVVVYDSAGLFSAARAWWLFRLFGHPDTALLHGGLPAWKQLDLPVTEQSPNVRYGNFTANMDPALVASMADIRRNCESAEAVIVDARSADRFAGTAPEPRPELQSGHMPGAISLPFNELLDKGKLKPETELHEIFSQRSIGKEVSLVTSCGSGVTAAIITLALDCCGLGLHRLYDGSWTEWASDPDNPINTLDES